MPKRGSPRKNAQPIEIATVRRTDIKPWPLNPRTIDRDAEKRLWRQLDRYGLLAPLLVQRSTGHVIGGNQRLKWLDSKHADTAYELQVAYADLTDEQAKAVAIHLNNASAQGSWNLTELERLLESLAADAQMLADASFSPMDLEAMFPTSTILAAIAETSDAAKEVVKAAASTKACSKEYRKAANQRASEKRDSQPYIVVVFSTAQAKRDTLAALGLPHNDTYIDADRITMQPASA